MCGQTVNCYSLSEDKKVAQQKSSRTLYCGVPVMAQTQSQEITCRDMVKGKVTASVSCNRIGQRGKLNGNVTAKNKDSLLQGSMNTKPRIIRIIFFMELIASKILLLIES